MKKGYADGNRQSAQLLNPVGVCFSHQYQVLIVCDYANNKLRKVSLNGMHSPSLLICFYCILIIIKEMPQHYVTLKGHVLHVNSQMETFSSHQVATKYSTSPFMVCTYIYQYYYLFYLLLM